MLFATTAKGILVQVDHSSQILREKQDRETIGPIDSEVSSQILFYGKTSDEHARRKNQQKGGMSTSSNTGNPQKELMDNAFN